MVQGIGLSTHKSLCNILCYYAIHYQESLKQSIPSGQLLSDLKLNKILFKPINCSAQQVEV